VRTPIEAELSFEDSELIEADQDEFEPDPYTDGYIGFAGFSEDDLWED
jgi:hypothetical protein